MYAFKYVFYIDNLCRKPILQAHSTSSGLGATRSNIEDELALPDPGPLSPTTSERGRRDHHFNDANFTNNGSPPSGNSGQLPIDLSDWNQS